VGICVIGEIRGSSFSTGKPEVSNRRILEKFVDNFRSTRKMADMHLTMEARSCVARILPVACGLFTLSTTGMTTTGMTMPTDPRGT
jgi:hypothetical protein